MEDLKQRFGELKRQYYPARQRFTLPSKPGQRTGLALEAGKKLSDYGLADGDVLVFKDLGPQVGHAAGASGLRAAPWRGCTNHGAPAAAAEAVGRLPCAAAARPHA